MKFLTTLLLVTMMSYNAHACLCNRSDTQALLKAVKNDNAQAVQTLLADPDASSTIDIFHEECLFFLNPRYSDRLGRRLCFMGMTSNNQEIQKAFSDYYSNNIDLLWEADPDLFALKSVLRADNLELFKTMLTKISLNERNRMGKPLLFMAAEAACCVTGKINNCLRYLIENTAVDINSTYVPNRILGVSRKYELAHHSFYCGQTVFTVLDFVMRLNRQDLIDYLESYGAKRYIESRKHNAPVMAQIAHASKSDYYQLSDTQYAQPAEQV